MYQSVRLCEEVWVEAGLPTVLVKVQGWREMCLEAAAGLLPVCPGRFSRAWLSRQWQHDLFWLCDMLCSHASWLESLDMFKDLYSVKQPCCLENSSTWETFTRKLWWMSRHCSNICIYPVTSFTVERGCIELNLIILQYGAPAHFSMCVFPRN